MASSGERSRRHRERSGAALGEQIEAMALRRDGFGQQATSQMSGIQPVPGIRLGVEHVSCSGRRPICGRRLAPMPIMPPHW